MYFLFLKLIVRPYVSQHYDTGKNRHSSIHRKNYALARKVSLLILKNSRVIGRVKHPLWGVKMHVIGCSMDNANNGQPIGHGEGSVKVEEWGKCDKECR